MNGEARTGLVLNIGEYNVSRKVCSFPCEDEKILTGSD